MSAVAGVKRFNVRESVAGRYCCKSPKLFGTDFFVQKQKLLRSSAFTLRSEVPVKARLYGVELSVRVGRGK
jgi:hypothetical protein